MLSVVIPALNEERAIGSVVGDAKRALRKIPHEILVVDGNSSDRTREIANGAGARVIVEKRRGYGRAYLAGISKARGDYVALIDADGTYPAKRLGELLSLLKESGRDFLLASRFSGRILPGAMGPLNFLGNRALTALTNFLFSDSLTDSQTGLRIYRKNDLLRMGLSSEGMEFASELNCSAKSLGLVGLEVPIDYSKREGSAKLEPLKDGLRHLSFLVGRRLSSGGKRKGAIFDIDGVLIENSEEIDYLAWKRVLKSGFLSPKIREVSREEFFARLPGKGFEETARHFYKRDLGNSEKEEIFRRKTEEFRALSGKLRKPKGIVPVLDLLESSGYSLGIASSARPYKLGILKRLYGASFLGRFRSILTSGSVLKKKPNPDIFLKCAREIGARPENCLVFEDSFSGIEAGKRAGMRVVAITTSASGKELKKRGADVVISSFSAFDPEKL